MRTKIKSIIIIIILAVISQWLAIRLVYAHKLAINFSYYISKVYNLKAGTISDQARTSNISLAKYLDHYRSLKYYVDNLDNNEVDVDIEELAWQRTIKDNWAETLSNTHELLVTDQEINEYLEDVVMMDQDQESFAEFSQETYGLSINKFKELIIRPYLIEIKIYQYLLDNYNDQEGMQRAQDAYEALEAGEDFMEVAKEFATDITYAENSVWLADEDLIDFYEPLKELDEGEFSKILIIPGAYLIWQVDSAVQDLESGSSVREARAIFIQAKSLDQFFQEYLSLARINKIY